MDTNKSRIIQKIRTEYGILKDELEGNLYIEIIAKNIIIMDKLDSEIEFHLNANHIDSGELSRLMRCRSTCITEICSLFKNFELENTSENDMLEQIKKFMPKGA